MPHLDLGDLKLYYEEEGQGEPLVLTHGAGSAIDDTEGSWAGIVGLLSTHFRTISIEHRGHGRTNNPGNKFDYATLADDVVRTANALSLESFHFAGVSDGAIVGLHLGMNKPEFIRSLILLGVNYRNDENTQRANATWTSVPDKTDDSHTAFVQSTRHDRGGKVTGSWRELFRGLVQNVANSPDYSEDDLRKIVAPTLLIAGEHDDYANIDQLLAMRSAISNSELCIINNAGHTVQFSHPHIVGPITVDFLQRNKQTL